MSLQDHDKSALHRELLRDLSALLAVLPYLTAQGRTAHYFKVWGEVDALIQELWGKYE